MIEHVFTIRPCRAVLGSADLTPSLPLYLASPCLLLLLLLTLGSAVPQHPLLKSSFTKSQSVPRSKPPHLESVPELHTVGSEC